MTPTITEFRDVIISEASKRHNVDFADILSKTRKPVVCVARKEAYRELYHLGFTQAQVARAFGRAFGGTVSFALRSRKRNQQINQPK